MCNTQLLRLRGAFCGASGRLNVFFSLGKGAVLVIYVKRAKLN
jgi:hypothetical protein